MGRWVAHRQQDSAEIAVAILAEMTAVRHGIALETVGIKTSTRPRRRWWQLMHGCGMH